MVLEKTRESLGLQGDCSVEGHSLLQELMALLESFSKPLVAGDQKDSLPSLSL